MKKKFILLCTAIIVVITLALLVGCDDSSITYGREYKITEFSAFADMTRNGTDKIEIYYAENNADITFTIKDAETIDDLMDCVCNITARKKKLNVEIDIAFFGEMRIYQGDKTYSLNFHNIIENGVEYLTNTNDLQDKVRALAKSHSNINAIPGGTDVHDVFDIRISWANWLDGTTVYEGCLNFDKMAISSVNHIPLHKFSSRSELDAFKARFGEDNSFDYGYNGKSFNENTADYDDTFFEANNLFLVYVDANSGSLQFDVNSIFNDGQSFCIYVNQTNNPENVTDDMAGWFITVAVPKAATEQCTAFDAVMGYGLKHSLTVIDESGHLVDVNAPKEYYAGEVVTLKGELVYDTYLTFYVDDVRIDVEQENVDNYLYYSFVMPSKDTTVVCKLVSVSPPPAPQ